jgi:hypothetical protein
MVAAVDIGGMKLRTGGNGVASCCPAIAVGWKGIATTH